MMLTIAVNGCIEGVDHRRLNYQYIFSRSLKLFYYIVTLFVISLCFILVCFAVQAIVANAGIATFALLSGLYRSYVNG